MARFALVHPETREVLEVLSAPADYPSTAPEWMRSRFKRNLGDPSEVPCAPLFVEVVTDGETPETKNFVRSRDCEVGGVFRASRRFERSSRPREETREERLERRIAELESRGR